MRSHGELTQMNEFSGVIFIYYSIAIEMQDNAAHTLLDEQPNKEYMI